MQTGEQQKLTNETLIEKPWPDQMDGFRGLGRGQRSTFLEYSYVAYQSKGNKAYNNMQANILRLMTPSPSG